jgi:hypothetical protein
VLIRVATSPNIENDPAVLDALLETDSWQTLATFARESARTSLFTFLYPSHNLTAIPLNIYSFLYSTSTSYTSRARGTVNSYHGR